MLKKTFCALLCLAFLLPLCSCAVFRQRTDPPTVPASESVTDAETQVAETDTKTVPRKGIMEPSGGGKRLYPVFYEKGEMGEIWFGGTRRIGFINQDAEAVTEPKYNDFAYYRDKDGRVQYVFARSGKMPDDYTFSFDVLDMDGKVVAVIETGDGLEPKNGLGCVIVGGGLFELDRMKMVIEPPARDESGYADYRTLTMVDENTVLVSDEDSSYFYDRKSGKKTETNRIFDPWEFNAFMTDPDTHAVPMLESDYNSKYGYMDRSGEWLLSPRFDQAFRFQDGYAYVGIDNGRAMRFIDKNFNYTGNEYNGINRTTSGYYIVSTGDYVLVENDGRPYYRGEPTHYGLLDPSLNEVIPLTEGCVIADSYQEDFVIVKYADKWSQVFDLTQKKILGPFNVDPEYKLPQYLGNGILFDSTSYLYDLNAGTSVKLKREYSEMTLLPDGTLCARYYDDNYASGFDLYDRSGNPVTGTLYEKFNGFFDYFYGSDEDPGIHNRYGDYYWVSRGQWQGYIDGSGNWLYRENRYFFLDD